MEFLMVLLLAIAAVTVLVWLYIARQGDAAFEFLVDQRTDLKLEEVKTDKAIFSCIIPFVNKGTQDGTIMDCYPRHLLPKEQYDGVEVCTRLALESQPREDGYFEALIVPKTAGNAIVLTVVIAAKQGQIQEALTEMVDMPVDIVYQVVARSNWYITKKRLVLASGEIVRALEAGYAGA